MSSTRGSSLIELMIALAIFTCASAAAFKALSFDTASSARRAISNLISLRTIQDELQMIADDAEAGLVEPIVISNLISKIGPFSAITLPKLGSLALAGAAISHDRAQIEVLEHPPEGVSFATNKFSSNEPTAAVGCTPTNCVELVCANNSCRFLSKSLLFATDESNRAFISIIYPITEIYVLYQSERNTLRKLTLIGGRIKSNQPVFDDVAVFLPRVANPGNFAGAFVAEALFSTARDPSNLFSTRAVQSVIAPRYPIEFLTLKGP